MPGACGISLSASSANDWKPVNPSAVRPSLSKYMTLVLQQLVQIRFADDGYAIAPCLLGLTGKAVRVGSDQQFDRFGHRGMRDEAGGAEGCFDVGAVPRHVAREHNFVARSQYERLPDRPGVAAAGDRSGERLGNRFLINV